MCRAARGFLDWTQDHLASVAGVSRSTVRDYEKGRHDLSLPSAARIVTAFETAGLEFLPARGHGPGVRLRRPALSAAGD